MNNFPVLSSSLNAARFEYEFLGKSVVEISQAYNLDVERLAQTIREERWDRRVSQIKLPDQNDIVPFTESLKEVTEARLMVISLFRQMDNQVLYSQLEKEILNKLLESAMNVNTDTPDAPNLLMAIAKTLMTMKTADPVQFVTKKEDQQPKMPTVVIQNNIQ